MSVSTNSATLRASQEIRCIGAFGLFSLCTIVQDGPWLPKALKEKLRGPADEIMDRLEALTREEIEELTRGIMAMERQGCLTGWMNAEELCRALRGGSSKVQAPGAK